mmetsp:Transcript_17493/g.31391  ORF Transcript_17493/g.31391 Transcript_17493/m.31391 type:complete len:881 (+) Transcript_17493:502-3144(+)
MHRRSSSEACIARSEDYTDKDVVTTFGRGTLIKQRSDGISVVQLRFGLAFLPTSHAPCLKTERRKAKPRKYHTMGKPGCVERERKVAKIKNFLRIDRQLQKNISNFKHKLSTNRSKVKKLRVVHLMRGGYYVRTKMGPIQVGMPPETIKDSLSKGLTLPTHFVIPRERFDLDNGLNLAECEFPAYYNFFILRKRINLITTKEIAESVRVVFQETLLGPQEIKIPAKFSDHCPKEAYPDLKKEISYFRENPFTKGRLEIDQVLEFTYFDDDGIATLEKGISIEDKGDRFIFRQDGKAIANVCSSIFPHPPDSFDGKRVRVKRHHPRQSVVFRNPPRFSTKDTKAATATNMPIMRRLSLEDVAPVRGFIPPYFGITMLGNSHGFDASGTTTGFVVWINRKGIMVDPPPYSSKYLKLYGIPPTLIREVILTHCHADHDAGTFQKILEEHLVTLVTTPIIMDSFVRKYSAVSGFSTDFLKKLFVFQPVTIGEPLEAHGGSLRFFYSLHSIPCVGFEAHYNGKSMVYSGDTLNHGPSIERLYERQLISEGRRDTLLNFPWHNDVILHECGVPPIHTPADTLRNLDNKIKERLYVVHVGKNFLKPEWGLKVADIGPDNTIVISNACDATMRMRETTELIRGVEILGSLGVEKVKEMLKHSEKKTVRKGGTIVREGDKSLGFYVVAMGFVALSVAGRPMKMLTVCDTFGEIPALFEKEYESTVKAITDVEILMFPAMHMREILKKTPVYEILRNLAKVQEEDSWQTLQANTCLDSWSAWKLRLLQSVLVKKEYKKDQIVWQKGQAADFAVLVANGEFIFETNDQIHPFERGAFVGEFGNMVDNKRLTTTLRCVEAGSCFVTPKEGLKKLFASNPGTMLLFLNRHFLE